MSVGSDLFLVFTLQLARPPHSLACSTAPGLKNNSMSCNAATYTNGFIG